MDASTTTSSAETLLWYRLRESGDDDARDALLAIHLPYAKVVAGVYYGRRFHDEIEFGEYLQYASVGLLEAMDRYDPSRGVQFRTFAARRMHGAILNGLEKLTEKQQQIAARQRMRAARMQDVRDIASQEASLGASMPQHPDQLLKFVSEVGIGLALCWMLDGTAMVDNPEAAAVVPFYQGAAVKQLREQLVNAIDALPANERTVIRAHYLQELPFERVAAMLNLTKGRISQIHKQALLRLRGSIGEHTDWNLSF